MDISVSLKFRGILINSLQPCAICCLTTDVLQQQESVSTELKCLKAVKETTTFHMFQTHLLQRGIQRHFNSQSNVCAAPLSSLNWVPLCSAEVVFILFVPC